MIVEGLSMPVAQRKVQADPCAEGLAKEPFAILESVASYDRRR
jgi:hypothetical protein